MLLLVAPFRRAVIAFAALAVTLAFTASAQAAPVWTPVVSGTTDDISAIEYQADDRFLFTTTNGKIFRREGGTFVQRLNAPGVIFNDIELRGSVGLAVGNAGAVYRSADGGATWAAITMPMSNDTRCSTAAPLGDVQKVSSAYPAASS